MGATLFEKQKKGPGDEGVKVVFGNDEDTTLVWKTLAPPRQYWQGDELWQSILTLRGWRTARGWLKLPESLIEPKSHHDWRLLQADPNGWPWNDARKSYSPITRIAEHVVCTTQEDARRLFLSKRQRAQHRLNLSMYKRRMFVDAADQAADHDVF